MASDNLQLDQLTGNENEKTNLINDIFQQLEDALTELTQIAVTGDVTLTSDQAYRNMVYQFTGTPGTARNIVVPDNEKLYLCENAVTDGSVLTVKTSAGSGIALAQGVKKILYCDGTNVIELGAGAQLMQTLCFGEAGQGPFGTGTYLRSAGWMTTSATIGYRATRVGSVIGIGVDLEVITETAAGTIDVEVMVAGAAVFSTQITTSGVGRYTSTSVQGPGIDAVAVGNAISVRITFGTFTGTLDNVVSHVELATSL